MDQSHNSTREEERPEERILNSLVAQADFSPADAVKQIVQITSSFSNAPSKQLGDHCYYTACALLEVAARCEPAQQPKLVSFFNQLRNTSVTTPSGEPLKHKDEAVWRDLPTFGYTFADELGSFTEFQEYTSQEGQRWENTIAFFAQLDASVSSSEPDVNFARTWALTFFTLAFDENCKTKSRELAVRLASIWFIHDAEKIWRNVSQSEGYSLQAWQRWKAALGEARLAADSEATKTLIGNALVQIEKVES